MLNDIERNGCSSLEGGKVRWLKQVTFVILSEESPRRHTLPERFFASLRMTWTAVILVYLLYSLYPRKLRLEIHQALVKTVVIHQIIMCSLLSDLASIENYELVRLP